MTRKEGEEMEQFILKFETAEAGLRALDIPILSSTVNPFMKI